MIISNFFEEMGNLFTEEVGKVLTRLLGNYLTEALEKVLDIYTSLLQLIGLHLLLWRGQVFSSYIESIGLFSFFSA